MSSHSFGVEYITASGRHYGTLWLFSDGSFEIIADIDNNSVDRATIIVVNAIKE